MASTISLTGDWMISLGSRTQTVGTGNLGTYTTAGIAVTAAQVGLGKIDSLVVDPAGGYVFEYVASTGKVKAYDQKDPAAAGGADIALPEVATSTSLAAITFNWRAIGS